MPRKRNLGGPTTVGTSTGGVAGPSWLRELMSAPDGFGAGEERDMTVLFTAESTSIGGREGRFHSTHGALQLDLAIPEESGGPGGRRVGIGPDDAGGFGCRWSCTRGCRSSVPVRHERSSRPRTGCARTRTGPWQRVEVALVIDPDPEVL
jgi:hypothetical protein